MQEDTAAFPLPSALGGPPVECVCSDGWHRSNEALDLAVLHVFGLVDAAAHKRGVLLWEAKPQGRYAYTQWAAQNTLG